MTEFRGKLNAEDMNFGIVISRFNEIITKNLLSGAIEGLISHGAERENITIVWVPGCFEIPVIASRLASSCEFDAIICLGAVIRGETDHYEHIATQAASGISQVALENELPVIFGLLTTDTVDQAIERCGAKSGNKGYDAALAAVEMASLDLQLLHFCDEDEDPFEAFDGIDEEDEEDDGNDDDDDDGEEEKETLKVLRPEHKSKKDKE
jgi:6,7-dimethyl-8-ribityllumazine synthase